MEYAVFKTGGKQYKVSKGDIVNIERINSETDKEISFDNVLLYVSNEAAEIGKPKLENVKVVGRVLNHIRGEKISVAKYKAKVRYRKVMGHRQALTQVKIENIVSESSRKKEKAGKAKKKI